LMGELACSTTDSAETMGSVSLAVTLDSGTADSGAADAADSGFNAYKCKCYETLGDGGQSGTEICPTGFESRIIDGGAYLVCPYDGFTIYTTSDPTGTYCSGCKQVNQTISTPQCGWYAVPATGTYGSCTGMVVGPDSGT
jgi:hypothetical protein